MARRLPFLRGKILRADAFQSVHGGERELPSLPARDPAQQRAILLKQLDAISAESAGRPQGLRDPEARRELVAIRPEPGQELDPASYADKRTDVRAVSVDPATGIVIIDTPDASLPHLRRKLDQYADPSKVNVKSGEPRNSRSIAPISQVDLARFGDRSGVRLRGAPLTHADVRWFEVACRGGLREPVAVTSASRGQISRALVRLGVDVPPQEYVATERVVFFLRLSKAHLEALIASVDCVYEFDIAPPDVRDWLLLEHHPVRELRRMRVTPPAQDAPSVAILDTGIAQGHPLLAPLIKTATSVVPGNPSPEDEYCHGTNMAGIAAYADVGGAVESGQVSATHWLESGRLLVRPRQGTAAERFRQYWPKFTEDAVKAIEASGSRPRVFAMAVTTDIDHPGTPTYWSHALDQIAYGEGKGRLFLVSAGNADVNSMSLIEGYPSMNLEQRLADPAQAMSALTVGAYTERVQLPPEPRFETAQVIAPAGGASPHTRAGLVASGAIKPDVVFEGGNVVLNEGRPDCTVDTLVGLTTGHEPLTRPPLWTLNGTSEATAHAARFIAQILRVDRTLWPTTVRGLVVHAASWTPAMQAQMPDIDERLAMSGYGVPDFELASACLASRATVIVEDEMPNSVVQLRPVKQVEGKAKAKRRARTSARQKAEQEEHLIRVAKIFKMPLPEDVLLGSPDSEVELRVTLSYFPEPNTFRRQLERGLDLKWDMQGPQESEEEFLRRINKLARGTTPPGGAKVARPRPTKPFPWDLGLKRRSRGTVQSDRWKGRAAILAGAKLIAVYPVLGWWDRRETLKTATMRFSLIITVEGEGLQLHNAIATELGVEIQT